MQKENDNNSRQYYKGWAVDWLRDTLSGGEIAWEELKKAQKAAEIPNGTLYHAAEKLGVKRIQKMPGRRKYWVLEDRTTGACDNGGEAAENPVPAVIEPVAVTLTRGEDGEPWADSREVAKKLGRDHFAVLRTIRELEFSNDFKHAHFAVFEINDLTKSSGKSTSHYLMTEAGFVVLCGKLRGEVASAIFESFINEFYRMREELHSIKHAIANDPASLIRQIIAGMDPSQRAVVEGFQDLALKAGGELAQTRVLAITYQEQLDAERAKVAELEDHKEKLAAKNRGYERFLDTGENKTIKDAAKLLEVKQKFLYAFLCGADGIPWLYRKRVSPHKWGYRPYEGIDQYIVTRESLVPGKTRRNGRPVSWTTCLITPLGLKELSTMFEVLNIRKKSMGGAQQELNLRH